jgi:uncharacterized protein
MKKTLFTFIFILSAFFVLGQESEENCLLWEISGNGLEQPSYIFGTVHLIPEDDFFFFDEWLEKLNTCDVLVLEADIDLGIMKQLSLIPKMKLPKKTTLEDYMTEEEFLAFYSFVIDTLQIKSSTYNVCLAYKPFFSYSLILNEVIPGKKIVYEQYLSDKAKKNKMKIIGLETIDFQISLIDSISIKDQIPMFLFDYKKEKQTDLKSEYDKTLSLYKNQDLVGISDLEDEGDEDEAYFYQKFLVDRNIDWIGKIKAIFKKRTAFIAVGAAHLPGETGVLQLLRNEGYTVVPVCKN